MMPTTPKVTKDGPAKGFVTLVPVFATFVIVSS